MKMVNVKSFYRTGLNMSTLRQTPSLEETAITDRNVVYDSYLELKKKEKILTTFILLVMCIEAGLVISYPPI